MEPDTNPPAETKPQPESAEADKAPEPQPIQPTLHVKPAKTGAAVVWSTTSFLEQLSHWLFRFGFASIFLVNAAYASLYPDDFTKLLSENAIAGPIGHASLLINIAMFNDLFLGIMILGGWRKTLVYAWAGAWLLIVAGLKLMNLTL